VGTGSHIDVVMLVTTTFNRYSFIQRNIVDWRQIMKTTKIDTSEFIKRAKAIHGDKYDYTTSHYTNSRSKVKITCEQHGTFEQLASNHLRGASCPQCSRRHKITNNDFVSRAKLVHGNRYDYIKVNYVNSKIKVKIVCPEHGEFEQQPYAHILGKGCSKCGMEKFRMKKTSSTKDFIKKAKKVHGDKFDYINVDYKGSAKKITIKCEFHGEFHQTPNSHLAGCGCPACAYKRDGGDSHE